MEDEERRRKIEYGRAIAAAWRLSGAADAMEDEERQRKIEYGRAIVEVWRLSQPSEAMEEEERRRKIEYARAKLAQYRQREARCVGQTTKKSKKVSSCKQDEHSSNINECRNDMFKNVSQRIETNGNADSTDMILFPSGQTKKHNQVLAESHASNSAPASQEYRG
ncbi:A-kinase anchor protein 9-like isoform X1 [Mesocricetus auratus]|uniref:A-kinase anchor protein 9-like isoform X1 n=1 Tax=Mesocricetus auratus TaxID=10036 RepID=A0ABM2X8H1_MESAU|nr:A-kinase anchor protein 9-like isoform X1 [Mesocricetus auratus]